MGKSNAQRQREWRERQKNFNLEEYRRKELDRVNAYKKKQNEKTFKAKHRQATSRWRENKRQLERENNPELENNPMVVDVSFMSRQSLGKAMKKVKNSLPKSPRKKKAVVQALATSMNLMQQKRQTSQGLDLKLIETIKAFYRREDIARFMPGAQDVITIWDEAGKRKEQKRILTMTVAEAYSLFANDHPEVTIGKSKFAELRPKEVLLSSKMPRNVCGCIYHENIALLLQELHRLLPDVFPLYSKEFVALCVCEIDSKVCMSSNCVLCKNKFKSVFVDAINHESLQKEASWNIWEKIEEDGRTAKTSKTGNTQDLLNALESKLKKFLFHYFINKQQTDAYNYCKNVSTEQTSRTAMVQMDFSENFSCNYQDEVSSAHWKTTSVTLFTVMIWFREYKISMVLLSDNNVHDKTTVVPYTLHVFNHVKETFGSDVSELEVWTDGQSSQFKNKFIFAYVGLILPKLFEFGVTWNYSATSHGKGAVDGIGGLVKRLATAAIVTRKSIIKDAQSMYDAIESKTRINLAVMSPDYISSTLKDLDVESLWGDINTLPGTLHIHCLEQMQQSVKTSHYKYDEAFIIHPLKQTDAIPVQENAPKSFSVGEYVIIKYDNSYYPGEITNVSSINKVATIRTMEKSGPKFWKWPNKEDILDYSFQDIVRTITPPCVVSNRGTYSVSDLDFV